MHIPRRLILTINHSLTHKHGSYNSVCVFQNIDQNYPLVNINSLLFFTWPSRNSWFTQHPIMVDPSSSQTVGHNQRVTLHFPVVFLWFSYGFPMVFPAINVHHPVPTTSRRHTTSIDVPSPAVSKPYSSQKVFSSVTWSLTKSGKLEWKLSIKI